MSGESSGEAVVSFSRLVVLTGADPDLLIMHSFFRELDDFASNLDIEVVWRIIDGLKAYPSSFSGFDFAANSVRVEWNSPYAALSHAEAIAYGFFLSQAEFVVMMSPDMVGNIKDIPNFILEIKNGASIVAAWRKKRNGVSILRVALTKVFNGFAKTVFGLSVHDVNTSMALVSPAAISFFLNVSDDCPSPALHTARTLKREIREVPITVDEFPGKTSVYSTGMRIRVGIKRVKEIFLYYLWSFSRRDD